VLVAIPTVIIADPLFAKLAARWVDVPAPHLFDTDAPASGPAPRTETETGTTTVTASRSELTVQRTRPTFGVTLATVLLPVVLMLAKALADIFLPKGPPKSVLDIIGTPLMALLIAVVVAMFTLGGGARMGRKDIAASIEQSLPPIAGILLIVAAGGGFKQVLVDTKIGDLIAGWVSGSGFSVLLLGWLVAVLIRLATGSATVATVTAAGILAPLVATLDPGTTSLLVLAIGSGSLFLSHVNDAGFWLVKEYFGISVGQTLRTWSVMETLISVLGLVFVLLLGLVI
jgi:GntP family gluconate:H+ symporter